MRVGRYGCVLAVLLAPAAAQAGNFKTLYAFGGANDGVGPMAALIAGNGALYGTTFRGGPDGSGTVFSLDLQTDAESVLTSRMISLPATPVLLAHDVLYGTTTAGDNGQGTIYAFDLKTDCHDNALRVSTRPRPGLPERRDQDRRQPVRGDQ